MEVGERRRIADDRSAPEPAHGAPQHQELFRRLDEMMAADMPVGTVMGVAGSALFLWLVFRPARA